MAVTEFRAESGPSMRWRKNASRLLRTFRGGLCFFIPWVFFVSELAAQFKFREPPNRQLPDTLDRWEGADLWQQFLLARHQGIFTLEGDLSYRPADRPSTQFTLSLEADWNDHQEETLIVLQSPSGERHRRWVRAVINVAEIQYKLSETGNWIPLEGMALGDSIFPDVPLTWQDLLMPFLKWESVLYLGPQRAIGRPAHAFRLTNPNPGVEPAEVEVVIDEDFAALLEVRFFDLSRNLKKRLRVTGFKEFDGGWLFSALVWENRSDRSSTRLEVFRFETQPH